MLRETSRTSAARERARALCARADAIKSRTIALRVETGLLVADTIEVRRRSMELRRIGQRQRIVVVPTALLTPPPPLRTSGRIARRTDRRQLSAASADVFRDDGSARDRASARADDWANAAVYGTRTIEQVPAHEELGEDPLTWTIREVDARDVPGARGARCLVFENHRIVRRIWQYPRDWATIPSSALLALAGSP